jgi:hypothetical protein
MATISELFPENLLRPTVDGAGQLLQPGETSTTGTIYTGPIEPTVFPYVRSGRPRVVVCAPDLAVFQQSYELILIEEQFAKRLAQHWWTHVLSGMGFPE